MRIKCGDCGWWGTDDELSVKYKPNPSEPEGVCPSCGNEFWDEIQLTARSSVEIGYPSGRRVEYFYNSILSEKQPKLL